jgi:subtilisin family serine protease
VNADNDPTGHPSRKFPDEFDHGTALAGLIAAVPDNSEGIAGVGRNVSLTKPASATAAPLKAKASSTLIRPNKLGTWLVPMDSKPGLTT